MKTALCLFEQSGTFRELYESEGYNAVAVDKAFGDDILTWDYKQFSDVDVIIAHPPCTKFSIAGVRHWKSTPPEVLQFAISLVRKTIEIIEYHQPRIWFIENPPGRLERCVPEMKQFYRWTFNPCDYARYSDHPQTEAYTKRTILYGQNIKPKNYGLKPLAVPDTFRRKRSTGGGACDSLEYMYFLQTGKRLNAKNRNRIRSKTPQGFARAFVQANRNFKPCKQLKLSL